MCHARSLTTRSRAKQKQAKQPRWDEREPRRACPTPPTFVSPWRLTPLLGKASARNPCRMGNCTVAMGRQMDGPQCRNSRLAYCTRPRHQVCAGPSLSRASCAGNVTLSPFGLPSRLESRESRSKICEHRNFGGSHDGDEATPCGSGGSKWSEVLDGPLALWY